MAEERTILQRDNVTVTSARVVLGGQTFALSGITSVRAAVIEPKWGGVVLAVLAGVMFIMIGGAAVFLGIASLALAAVMAAGKKPMHRVVLVTSAGEQTGLETVDRAEVAEVVKTVSDAIVAHG